MTSGPTLRLDDEGSVTIDALCGRSITDIDVTDEATTISIGLVRLVAKRTRVEMFVNDISVYKADI